ncbi:TVP38/TMEM64 family protein [Dactylosporangium sp. CA-052675]|uniref:TVP38/TMEM64 family protein n=1 Tax=Dactylosporangium sp. CA-052675 TaxID=3239927 RepID=UPI003D8B46B0
MTRTARLLRLAGLVALVGGLVTVAILVGLPGRDELRAAMAGLGWWAPVACAGLYAVACLSPLPKTVLTLAAGALFGVAGGLAVVVCGALLGAVAALYLGRLLGRDAVRWLAGGRLDAFDARLTRHGIWAIVVARLIPVVPFTAVNYLAGVTSVRLRDFVLGTAVGILPATTAYVTVGAYGWQPGAWPLWAALAALVVLTAGGLLAERRRRGRRAAGSPGDPVET